MDETPFSKTAVTLRPVFKKVEKNMAKTKEMTSGAPLPQIFQFTLPLLMGNVLQQTYSLVDAAIVGRCLGIDALASVGASSSVIFLILGFCLGCGGGFGIPVAQKFGARDYVAVRRLVGVSFKVSAVMSIAVAIITSLLTGQILHLMRTPESIFGGAYDYLLITFIGVPCAFFYNLLSSIIRALGDSKTPFWFLMISTVMNILLDLLFILVFGWGVSGAAIATLVAQGVSAVLCYIYMRSKYEILHMDSNDMKFRPELARQLVSIGVPMGLQFSITAIGSIMLQSSNNSLGTECVAAFTAAMRIKMFFISAIDSLGIAMATYAGQNYGAGRPDRIWQGIKASCLLFMAYTAIVAVVLWTGAESIALLFVDASEAAIIGKTSLFLCISVCFFPLLGLLSVLRNSIQGAGYTHLALFSGVSEMIARALVSVTAVPLWGFTAVCFGDPTAWLAACLFLVPAFRHVLRKLRGDSDRLSVLPEFCVAR